MKDRVRGAMSDERGGLHVDISFDREVLIALLDVVPPGDLDTAFVENAGVAPYTTAYSGCGRGSGDRFTKGAGTQ